MNTPETPKPIHELLPEAMRRIGAVEKKQRNSQQNFNFRGIDAITNAVSPVFRDLGIFVTPHLLRIEHSTAPTKGGGTMNLVWVEVDFTFYGPAGDKITVTVPAESFDAGDKATAKAMSVALRTALLQTLLLPTDEPDPDQSTYERAAPTHERKDAAGNVTEQHWDESTPAGWLAAKAATLTAWDEHTRRGAATEAMRMLAIENPMSQSDVERVWGHMVNVYERAQAPFTGEQPELGSTE